MYSFEKWKDDFQQNPEIKFRLKGEDVEAAIELTDFLYKNKIIPEPSISMTGRFAFSKLSREIMKQLKAAQRNVGANIDG